MTRFDWMDWSPSSLDRMGLDSKDRDLQSCRLAGGRFGGFGTFCAPCLGGFPAGRVLAGTLKNQLFFLKCLILITLIMHFTF